MMLQFKEVIMRYVKDELRVPRVLEEYSMSMAWDKLGFPEATNNAHPDRLVGGVLYLNVTNSAWAQHINMLKPEILKRLNNELGKEHVRDIRLKTGYTEEKKEKAKPANISICAACQVEHEGGGALCRICERRKKNTSIARIYKALTRNIGRKFADIKKEILDADETEYKRAKRELSAREREAKIRARYDGKKK